MVQDSERVVWLERLIEISRSLNSTLSLRPLLHRILVAAQELTRTEACSILLLDRKSGQLRFEAATGPQGYRMRSIVVPMEGSIAGWVVQTGAPLVIPDVRSDPRHYHKADEQSTFTTHSILAVPLIARDNVIGVLEALNKKNGAEFGEEDVELLTVLGDQAAVAVQNALLFQQSDLIAEIVHEMRTPLAAILAYAELMQRADATLAQCRQFADVIRGEAERLNEMATNFLDLARLESGRAFFAQDPVDLSTVIRMAVSVLMPQADAKQIGNAVKYCRPGDEVTIMVRSEEDRLVVSVADTGPGIPAEALPHIFERFYRVPDVRRTLGAGLGLTIARQIVEAIYRPRSIGLIKAAFRERCEG